MPGLEDSAERQVTVLSSQTTSVRSVCFQVSIACLLERCCDAGVDRKTDSFTAEPCEIMSVVLKWRK
jgi:hypothetical protein